MKKLVYIFGIALFLFGCAGVSSLIDYREELVRKNPNDADAHRNLGITYHYSSHYQKAIASFKEAIRIKPDYAKAYYNLGSAYDELGQYQEAIVSYKEAIRIKPDYAKAYYNLGIAYRKSGRNDEAIAFYKEAIRITPNDAKAHYNLGVAYERLDRHQEAIASYKEAIRINPNDEFSNSQLGSVYNKLGQHKAALANIKEAVRIDPDDPHYHHDLGVTYENLGLNYEAIVEYKEALRIRPNHPLSHKSLIRLERRIAQGIPPLPTKQPIPAPSAKQQLVSGGTGFMFSSRDYIITNYHVVKGASSIDVKFPDGEVIKASVLAKDSQNDIAVLKLAQSPSTQIPDLKFGDSSKVRPGDKVFTIGYPASSILGKNQKITDGIISSVTGIEDDPTMFQITVPIQPGNSGGPLFNERGEVIGITTASLSLNAIQSLGAVPQNVNYAIKSSFVNNLLTTIPKTLLSNRGIVVVPNKPGNSLADFFERVSNNIVLIEAKE